MVAAEGLCVQVACRALGVSQSGYYARRGRAPSARGVRHAWLTNLITQVHAKSRGVYGIRRVHAELTLGHGIGVGREAVGFLMGRPGLQGLQVAPSTGEPVIQRMWRDQRQRLEPASTLAA